MKYVTDGWEVGVGIQQRSVEALATNWHLIFKN